MIFSAHIRESHYKGLDIPFPLDFGRIEGAARQWQSAVLPSFRKLLTPLHAESIWELGNSPKNVQNMSSIKIFN